MDKNFTDEEIKKALEQAEANMNFEEVSIPSLKNNNNAKILRKDLNYERNRIRN